VERSPIYDDRPLWQVHVRHAVSPLASHAASEAAALCGLLEANEFTQSPEVTLSPTELSVTVSLRARTQAGAVETAFQLVEAACAAVGLLPDAPRHRGHARRATRSSSHA